MEERYTTQTLNTLKGHPMLTLHRNRSRFFASVALLTMAFAGLAGCHSHEPVDSATQAKIDEQDRKRNAEIQNLLDNGEGQSVGTFDGCEVKYINRYYRDKSFYIARCASGTASTTTSLHTEKHGKYRHTRQGMAIRVDEPGAKDAAQPLKDPAAREKALSKLTDADRAALGLPARTDDKAPGEVAPAK